MSFLIKVREFLKNKKSYIIAGIGVLTGAALIADGQTIVGIQTILGALGIGALKAAIGPQV